MNANAEPMVVDVVSDVVCPWCYLGKKRLEAALAEEAAPVAVRWRPFQLDPTIPAGGRTETGFGLANRMSSSSLWTSVALQTPALAKC